MTSFKISNVGELATYDRESGGISRRTNVDLIMEDGKVAAIGDALPEADQSLDAARRLVTPGFVDPHTHPIFAYPRANEFGMRVSGKSYEEIATAGGGISASVEALRDIPENELKELTLRRLKRFLSTGTTTIEAKSGYGLSTESELKSLSILAAAAEDLPLDIVPTFLGAHDFPAEYSDDKDAYVDLICDEMIPAIAEQGIAEFCDAFCEEGWFDISSTKRILETGRKNGLKPRLHADEFTPSGAAELAAEIGAFSADHLMHVSDGGIERMAEAGVIAVLLPGTTFCLGKQTYAPARRLIDAGVEVALSTDFNPGSSAIQSMPFIMSLACIYLGLTVEESFLAATSTAAKSLGREESIGALAPGMPADLVIWDLDSLEEIPYHVAGNRVGHLFKSGKEVVIG
ncbi:MAG: imidazolonepropionase [Candidatus Neomarinimicrobiota bacterium]|nr:imidazolonepropionase [Candidatus Neomarinimicrobiota bacterium]